MINWKTHKSYLTNDFQILNLSQGCNGKDETLKVRNLIGKGKKLTGRGRNLTRKGDEKE